MKKSSLVFTSLIFTMGLQSFAAPSERAPSVVIVSDAAESDYAKLMNIMNNSLVYSSATNKILNGSGNSAFDNIKIPTRKPLSQILDQISYFDLYLQKSIKQNNVGNINFEMHLLPLENTFSNLNDPKLTQTQISASGLVDMVRPLIKSSVKIDTMENLYSNANLGEIRASQLATLKNRFPVEDDPGNGNILAKTQWLFNSFLPITASTMVKFKERSRTMKTSIVFPAFGYPKMLYKNINGATKEEYGIIPFHMSSKGTPGTIKMEPIVDDQAVFTDITFTPQLEDRTAENIGEFNRMLNSRALRIEITKDFDVPHLMGIDLSFGHLPKNVKRIDQMNVDDVTTQPEMKNLVKNYDFGLVVKGDMIFNENAIGNKWAREVMNDYLFRLFDIRLVFHKIHLNLNRIPVRDPMLKPYEAQFALGSNLDFFLNKDVGFDLENMQYDDSRSVVNVIISVKPDVQKEILSGSFLNFDKGNRELIMATFCGLSSLEGTRGIIKDKRMSDCQYVATSLRQFKSEFVSRLVNDVLMGMVNKKIKDKTSQEMKKQEIAFDDSIEQITKTLLNEWQTAKSTVTDMMTAAKQ